MGPDHFNWKTGFLHSREDVNPTGFHGGPCPLGMSALPFLYRASFAEIARPGPQAKCLPGPAEENVSLKVSDDCLDIRRRVKVEQDSSAVGIEHAAHLLGCRGKRRTNKALPITIASELAFQPDPGSSLHVRRRNDASILHAGILLRDAAQFFAGQLSRLCRGFTFAIHVSSGTLEALLFCTKYLPAPIYTFLPLAAQ